jgi:predicted metal-binding membrane protein
VVLRLRSITADSTTGPAVALFGIAAASWVVSGERMRGMDMGPGTNLGAFGFYVVTWVVMMSAMMLPSVAPMVTSYARLQRARVTRRSGTTAVFVSGYLIVWTLFGIAAYGVFEAVRHLSGDWLSWGRAGRWLTVAILLAAAGYQLTPAKEACLRRCRSTIPFLTREWRDGRSGAFRMGALHGAWCSGCCWALMVALFALGVMSLTWMALAAAAIAAEKLLPRPQLAARTIALALAILGAGIALSPSSIPGLTMQKGHPMHGMRRAPAKTR